MNILTFVLSFANQQARSRRTPSLVRGKTMTEDQCVERGSRKEEAMLTCHMGGQVQSGQDQDLRDRGAKMIVHVMWWRGQVMNAST